MGACCSSSKAKLSAKDKLDSEVIFPGEIGIEDKTKQLTHPSEIPQRDQTKNNIIPNGKFDPLKDRTKIYSKDISAFNNCAENLDDIPEEGQAYQCYIGSNTNQNDSSRKQSNFFLGNCRNC